MWKTTTRWRPRLGTGSGPFPVEKDGQLGLAKQRGMDKEKLTSDLAAIVLINVPKVEFDAVEGKTGAWAISHVHSPESADLGLVAQHAPDLFKSSQAV